MSATGLNTARSHTERPPEPFARAAGGLWEDGELGTIHAPPGSQNPIRSTVVSVAWAPAAWTGKVSKLAVCPG